jgi:hypothetical protein
VERDTHGLEGAAVLGAEEILDEAVDRAFRVDRCTSSLAVLPRARISAASARETPARPSRSSRPSPVTREITRRATTGIEREIGPEGG